MRRLRQEIAELEVVIQLLEAEVNSGGAIKTGNAAALVGLAPEQQGAAAEQPDSADGGACGGCEGYSGGGGGAMPPAGMQGADNGDTDVAMADAWG